MYGDFNRIVVQLTQHPVMYKPLSDLTYTECELAYALIRELIGQSKGIILYWTISKWPGWNTIWVNCLVR